MIDSGRLLAIAVGLYTVLLFGSQALMSIGFAACLVAILFAGTNGSLYRTSLGQVLVSSWGRRYLKATFVLLIAFFASVLAAQLFPVEIGGVHPRARWGTSIAKAVYFIWPILLSSALVMLEERAWRRVQNLWVGVFVVVSVFGVIELFTGWNPRGLVEQRPHASFGGLFTVNWIFGSYLTYASVMVFPFFFLLERASKRHWLGGRSTHWLALLIGALALFGTMSRMLWIALPLGLVLFLMLTLKGRTRWKALAAIVLALAGATLLPPVQKRLHYPRGLDQRTQLWKINWELFKMRPLTGVGWHENLPLAGAYFETHLPEAKEKFVGHAHSNLLEFLGGMGLLGLMAWLGWSLVTAGMAYLVSPGLFCAFVVLHLNGLTQVNFSETKTLHTVVWCVAFAMAANCRRSEQARPGMPRP